MQAYKIQNHMNTPFGAGTVNIRKIKARNILQLYAIKKIAEEDNLDIFIKKLKESKYLPNKNFYIVYAKHEIDKFPFSARGTSSVIVNKNAKNVEISAKIYNAVLKSIDELSSKIHNITGEKPKFLSLLKQ